MVSILRRGSVPRDHMVTIEDCPRGDTEHAIGHLLRMLETRPAAFSSDRLVQVRSEPVPEVAVSREEHSDCAQWPETRDEWEAWHMVTEIRPAAALEAWLEVTSVRSQ